MADHDLWVERGFCPAIYTGEEDDEHWCRMPAEDDGNHHDAEGTVMPHIAPWEYNFPRQETMIRWKGPDDAPTDVEWLVWKPDPATNIATLPPFDL